MANGIEERKTLDIEQLIASQLGGTVSGVNDDGSVRFKRMNDLGEEEEKTFDLPAMAQAQGLDLSSLDVKINSPQSALEESGLSFREQLQFATIPKASERLTFLKEGFGDENVKMDSERGPVVKGEDGVWRKADAGILAGLAAEAPTIAGGIKGAALGSTVGPLGTVAGGVIGAGLGKLSTIAAAHTAGIRTESDAEDAIQEAGKEMLDSLIWSGGMVGAGRVLKLAKPALGDVAETIGRMVNVPKDAIVTLLKPENTKRVLQFKKEAVAFERSGARGLDPMTKAIGRNLRSLMGSAKRSVNKSFDEFNKAMGTNIQKIPKANILDLQNDLRTTFRAAGLTDNNGRFLRPNEMREGVQQFIVTSDVNKFKKIQGLVDNAARRGGAMSFEDLRTLRRNMDDILESSGAFRAASKDTITTRATAEIKRIREGITNKLVDQLKGIKIQTKDGPIDAARMYQEANAKYHKFRNVFDDFAQKDMFNPDKINNTVNKIVRNEDGTFNNNVLGLAEVAGKNGKVLMEIIRMRESARHISQLIRPGLTGAASLPGQLTGPRAITGLATLGTRAASRKPLGRIQRGIRAVQSQPITQSTVNQLQKIGQAVDFFTVLPHKARVELISNPELWRGFKNSTIGAVEEEERMTEALVQEALQ